MYAFQLAQWAATLIVYSFYFTYILFIYLFLSLLWR